MENLSKKDLEKVQGGQEIKLEIPGCMVNLEELDPNNQYEDCFGDTYSGNGYYGTCRDVHIVVS